MPTMLKKKALEEDAQLYLTTINFIRLFSVFNDIASEEDAQLHPTTINFIRLFSVFNDIIRNTCDAASVLD